jgi:FixJ family two-component response regulator
MINLNDIKITPRDQQVLRLLVQGCSNKEIASQLSMRPPHCEATPSYVVSARRDQGRPEAGKTCHRHVH